LWLALLVAANIYWLGGQPTWRNNNQAMPDTAINLSDGSARLINDDSWPVSAISPPRQVREHYGELLSPSSPDVNAAIARVAFNYGISIQCAVDCIKQVKDRRDANP
jgi:hypothetical protein